MKYDFRYNWHRYNGQDCSQRHTFCCQFIIPSILLRQHCTHARCRCCHHDQKYFADQPIIYYLTYKKHCSNRELAEEIYRRGYDKTGRYSNYYSPMMGGYSSTLETSTIICDCAEPKSIADLQVEGLKAIACRKFPGCVLYRIKWLQNRKIVIDPARTPNAYREFTNYEYETDKDGVFLSDVPDRNNHCIDATAYALDRLIYRRGESA